MCLSLCFATYKLCGSGPCGIESKEITLLTSNRMLMVHMKLLGVGFCYHHCNYFFMVAAKILIYRILMTEFTNHTWIMEYIIYNDNHELYHYSLLKSSYSSLIALLYFLVHFCKSNLQVMI